MILELKPEQIITPGYRVIERETRRALSRKAAANSRTIELRKAREAFAS